MDYYLYKLRFDRAVHFGPSDSSLSLSGASDHFCADTLFSALCHTARALWGDAGLDALCAQVRAGELLLSDGMPWRERGADDIYYIPKPCAVSGLKQDIPPKLRKTMKKLSWLPVNDVEAFAASLRGKGFYVPEAETPLGVVEQRTCAAIQDGQDARPYQVSAYRFFPGCGLYFLAGCATSAQGEQLSRLLTALGLSGFGGKVSAGYGTFQLEDTLYLNEPFDFQTEWLYNALTADKPNHYLLLTSSLPADNELDAALDGAQYQPVRRGGFVQSNAFSDSPLKKQTQYFLASGAMLKRPFSGGLYQVGQGGRHPVYRYAVPLMLGVSF